MGWLRKKVKQLGKGIKKIGKKIGKAFKKIIKPFAKIFNKLGPLGTMALMFILPGLGTMMAGWGATLAQGSTFLGQMAGTAIKFVGNAINFVATAPQKIFKTITGGITNAWSGLTGNVPAAGIEGSTGSWFGNFKADMQSAWTSGGAVDTLGQFGPKGEIVGEGNWFDYSQQGQAKLGSFKSDFKQMGTDIADVFRADSTTPLTEANAPAKFKTLFTDTTGTFDKIGYDDALKTFTDQSVIDLSSIKGGEVFKLDRTGAIGNIRDFVGGTVSKIADVTIPGVGDLGDVGWGAKTAVSTYSTLGQFGIVGPDGEQAEGVGDMGYLANQQLYGGDTGGLYNTSAPPWDYDSAVSAFQNATNAQNSWNSNYGLPQGFNPMQTPGWGWTYPQWLQQQMAA